MKNQKARWTSYLALGLGITFGSIACKKTVSPINTDRSLEQSQSDTFIQGELIPNQYIVVLKDTELEAKMKTANYSDRKKMVAEKITDHLASSKIEGEVALSYGKVLLGGMVKMTAEQAEKLKLNKNIERIEQDKTIGLTPYAKPGNGNGNSGGGGAVVQETPWGITRIGGAGNGVGKTVWVIDSGVDLDHPDLTVDVTKSATFLGGNSTPDDQNGHGTHVAGTIGALNNGIGVVGVAAGATIVAVRVLDRKGSGSISGVIAGVDYVAANAGTNDVANMSLGGGVSTSLDNAVIAAANSGVKFALAAGNESDNANNHSPARVNGTNLYTISAMNSSDAWASFSNYGAGVDYCAPGVGILSTWKSGGYNTISGTSMAAPHVAGILALGGITTSGYVTGDPDGNADPIAHR